MVDEGPLSSGVIVRAVVEWRDIGGDLGLAVGLIGGQKGAILIWVAVSREQWQARKGHKRLPKRMLRQGRRS